jgi:inner membrane protein
MALRESPFLKLVLIGLLTGLLSVPLGLVLALVYEREGRSNRAVAEISQTWGAAQTLQGPVLSIPYRTPFADAEGRQRMRAGVAHFLPARLAVSARLAAERRSRGIYEAVLYRSAVTMAGEFESPTFGGWQVEEAEILWDAATLSLGIPDPHGVQGEPTLRVGVEPRHLFPGVPNGPWPSGVHAPVPLAPLTPALPFQLDLELQGSQSFEVLPVGKETELEVSSAWPHPSFRGALLPQRREVGPQGFTAAWRVSYFQRGFPQRWRASEEGAGVDPAQMQGSAFGVALVEPAGTYQQCARAVKYGFLFLGLTFLLFFMFELFGPTSLHPLHYLFVGFALCLFYLLVLSLSEHLAFAAGYTIAAAACVLLIAGYARAVLGERRRAALLAAVLIILYGFLYVLLQLEEYALLIGSVALFVLLALVMYATRRVDWYGARQARA